jgi:hypothetical protein
MAAVDDRAPFDGLQRLLLEPVEQRLRVAHV